MSDMWLLRADSSSTRMLIGLRYLSPAVLENTGVAIFPEEAAACNYTCLAVEKELKSKFGTGVALLPPVDLHFSTHKGP